MSSQGALLVRQEWSIQGVFVKNGAWQETNEVSCRWTGINAVGEIELPNLALSGMVTPLSLRCTLSPIKAATRSSSGYRICLKLYRAALDLSLPLHLVVVHE